MNVYREGLQYYGLGTRWQWIPLLARITTLTDTWVGYFINEIGQTVEIILNRVDGQLAVNTTTVMPPGSRFPFGWTVEPDV